MTRLARRLPAHVIALVLALLTAGAAPLPVTAAAATVTVPSWSTFPPGGSVAHRGGPCCAPENTMAAFRNAYQHDVPAIELDVHLLADGRLGVIHDATVDRTTNATGPVSSFTTAEFRALGLPSLADVLREFGNRTLLVIEPKVAGTTDAIRLMQGLTAYGIRKSSVVINSFHRDDLLAAEARGYQTMWLNFTVADVAAGKGEWVAPKHTRLTATMVAAAHRRGIRVATWTITTPEQEAVALAKGVDAVITDRPREMVASG
jgi:glycerophosphoryl diester phosphodiesterase